MIKNIQAYQKNLFRYRINQVDHQPANPLSKPFGFTNRKLKFLFFALNLKLYTNGGGDMKGKSLFKPKLIALLPSATTEDKIFPHFAFTVGNYPP